MKQQLTTTHQELTTVNRQLHEKDFRLAQISLEYENLQHRFKVEVINHKIDLAKVQRDQLEIQEQSNTRIQGSLLLTLLYSLESCTRLRLRRTRSRSRD